MSWMVEQLPAHLASDPFLVRFVGMLQTVTDSLRDQVDGLEHVLDPSTAPESLVGWLGSWLAGDALDGDVPVARQRAVVAALGRSSRARGTAPGVAAYMAALTGGPVRVRDDGGVWRAGEGRRGTGKVVVDLSTTGGLATAVLLEQVRRELPAGTRPELRVRGERVER